MASLLDLMTRGAQFTDATVTLGSTDALVGKVRPIDPLAQ